VGEWRKAAFERGGRARSREPPTRNAGREPNTLTLSLTAYANRLEPFGAVGDFDIAK
jgi:hypothetical protein